MQSLIGAGDHKRGVQAVPYRNSQMCYFKNKLHHRHNKMHVGAYGWASLYFWAEMCLQAMNSLHNENGQWPAGSIIVLLYIERILSSSLRINCFQSLCQLFLFLKFSQFFLFHVISKQLLCHLRRPSTCVFWVLILSPYFESLFFDVLLGPWICS